MSFRVDLDIFRGPLDLLLYLVRNTSWRSPIFPIAPITDQFLEHLAVLEQLDVNAVGDFLEMASTLVELKSRHAVAAGGRSRGTARRPTKGTGAAGCWNTNSSKTRPACSTSRAAHWQERFPRLANDLAGHKRDLAEEPIRELELWDLVSALRPADPAAPVESAIEHRLRRHADSRLHGTASATCSTSSRASPLPSCSSPACTSRR